MIELKHPEVSHHFEEINGINLHFVTAGKGEKLVVLLHGFPESWYCWREQIPELAKNFTVVAPDLRGFGESEKPLEKGDYDLSIIANDIANLVKHLGFKEAAFVGHDWGALVAWMLVEKHSELVSRVVALQIPPIEVIRKNLSFAQLRASWYIFFFMIPGLPERMLSKNDYGALAKALVKTTAERDIFKTVDIQYYKNGWKEKNSVKSMLNYYRANIVEYVVRRKHTFKRISIPTLFIYGEKDQAILASSIRNSKQIFDQEYRELRIPNSAHWVQIEAAKTVNEAIMEFLQSGATLQSVDSNA